MTGGWETGLPGTFLLGRRVMNLSFLREENMRIPTVVMMAALLLTQALPAVAKDKKKQPNRGMLEKMEAVPCGAKERGLTGLGSIFGSVGVTHVNSDEKLCPQYLLRTDEMEYHIQPADRKHPVVLPVGKEGVFKIKKDRMLLKVPEGDRKTRSYYVVAMKPINSDDSNSSDSSSDKLVGPDHKMPAQGAEIPNAPVNGTQTNMSPVQR